MRAAAGRFFTAALLFSSRFLLTGTWHFSEEQAASVWPVCSLEWGCWTRRAKMWRSPKTGHPLLFLGSEPNPASYKWEESVSFHLAGGRRGGGVYKWRRDIPHPGNVDLRGHSTSLYPTVISTSGNVHNTVGCSFPFLPPARQGGLQCGGDMTIPSTFTSGQIHPHRQRPYFSTSTGERTRCLMVWRGFQAAKNTRRHGIALFFWTEVAMPTREKETVHDKWRCFCLTSEIHHSLVLHKLSFTFGQSLNTGSTALLQTDQRIKN